MKTTSCHQGGMVFLRLWDKLLRLDGTLVEEEQFSQFRLTEARLMKYCREMLVTFYSKLEWAYHLIRPRILIEEKLTSRGRGELMNYRLFTFHGIIRAISKGSFWRVPDLMSGSPGAGLDTIVGSFSP